MLHPTSMQRGDEGGFLVFRLEPKNWGLSLTKARVPSGMLGLLKYFWEANICKLSQ